jgi:tRNA(Ile)-lysidine synthase TilS/MesJ
MDAITCRRCILNSSMPGVTVDPGTCICRSCEEFRALPEKKRGEYRAHLDLLLGFPPAHGKFDAVFALSGGIDSSYALYRVKKENPHLAILAVQFDNGFISETALENARRFCDLTESKYLRLALDQDALCDTFSRAARSLNAYPRPARNRASDICNTCIGIVKQKLIELAVSTGSPFLLFAFSPGQADAPFIVLTRPFMAWMRGLFDANLKAMGVPGRDAYLMDAALVSPGAPDPRLTIIHPYLAWEYDKPAFKRACIALGWTEPGIDDQNSSNCLLNAFATRNHLEKYGIHPYAHDLAALVRQGYMRRDDALEMVNAEVVGPSIDEVRRQLNLP